MAPLVARACTPAGVGRLQGGPTPCTSASSALARRCRRRSGDPRFPTLAPLPSLRDDSGVLSRSWPPREDRNCLLNERASECEG